MNNYVKPLETTLQTDIVIYLADVNDWSPRLVRLYMEFHDSLTHTPTLSGPNLSMTFLLWFTK